MRENDNVRQEPQDTNRPQQLAFVHASRTYLAAVQSKEYIYRIYKRVSGIYYIKKKELTMPVGADGFRLPNINEKGSEKKLDWLTGPGQNEHCRTFVITGEDHTLGNALKHFIIQNSAVEFCGYTVPHPMERKIHVRIQTKGTPAEQVLRQALSELKEQNEAIKKMIQDEIKRYLETHPQADTDEDDTP
ncbi:DNA-directed RNA polymerases I and III subunit RPAC2 isoform X1 [Procambarus clarkii]|uniref:DNA-directed RNA polymerases I and III subunit RPAC2 isoform X1 n=1 Tax=Procambarus clarkii TaxID=6728 RepID=UPI001E67618B|nr:DNA-directed RNA polymerases I and III subunit RPAC2-like isoform X1 [Procambarus clarkii]